MSTTLTSQPAAPEPPTPAPRRRRPRKRIAVLIAIPVVILVAFLVWALSRSKQPTDSANSPLVGKAAPELVGRTLEGGNFNLANTMQNGQGWVLVNFFASWCVPCQQEAPEIHKIAEEHRAAGDGQVVSVLFSDTPGNASAFFKTYGGGSPPGPVVVGGSDQIALDWGVSKVPETYLVAPDGTVVWKTITPLNQHSFDQMLAKSQGSTGK